MRFKSFSLLPVDVVATTETSKAAVNFNIKKKKKNNSVVVVPDKQQLDLIKSVALLVDPRIWLDPNIFPSDPTTLRALAAMTENAGQNCSKYFLGSGYIAAFDDEEAKSMCVYKGVTRVFVGTVGGAYRFATTCAPAALSAIKEACCKNLYKAGADSKDLASMLTAFRTDRSWAKSLDKATKICQLDYIDQDKTVNKFAIDGELLDDVGDFCIHLGSGDDNGTSVIALKRAYNEVVCVDPRIRHQGPGQYSQLFDPKDCEYGDIVSDIAYGDAQGMVVGEMHKYIKQLYTLCAGRLVIAKIVIEAGYGNVKGFLLNKPRPHNMELIVQLHEEGDLLDDLCSNQRAKVVEANERRNTWVHRQEIPIGFLPTYNSSSELRFLLMTDKENSRPHFRSGITRLDRNSVLLSGQVRMNAEQWKRFVTRCRDSARMQGDAAILPLYYRITPGRVRNHDIVFPDAVTNFNSICYTAEQRGFSLVFKSEWMIKKKIVEKDN